MTMQEYSELTKAVIVRLDLDDDPDYFDSTMRDIANHGADAGFHGFIYYHETCAFYDANQELIWEAINSETSLKNALAWYALERAANEVTNALEEAK
jgi:hypothetical protein